MLYVASGAQFNGRLHDGFVFVQGPVDAALMVSPEAPISATARATQRAPARSPPNARTYGLLVSCPPLP